jgi:hypothetical protein
MPEISRFFGIIVQVYYNDHEPAHFHVPYSGQRALIAIETGALLKGYLSPRALGLVTKWVADLDPDVLYGKATGTPALHEHDVRIGQ